jgi:hypothetical protein
MLRMLAVVVFLRLLKGVSESNPAMVYNLWDCNITAM